MSQLSNQQAIQDEQYHFPYHYVSSSTNGVFRQTYDWSWALNYQLTLDFILNRLQDEEFTSIVDIGCGDGRLTWELHKAFPMSRVLGLDYSQRSVGLAKNINPSVDYQVRDIITAKTEERFDRGMLIEVLEHIPDELESPFLEAISNMLTVAGGGGTVGKSNGVLYLTVPHQNQPLSPKGKHYRHYTVKSLAEKVSPYFEINECITFQKRCRRRGWVSKLLSNRYFILNHAYCLKKIYDYCRHNLFQTNDETNCERIFMRLTKK